MKGVLCRFVAMACAFTIHSSHADEQVTLKSGTTLVGVVSIDGANVHVKLGESQVTVPMADVKQIGPAGEGAVHNESAQRLLIIALESKIQNGSSESLVGLLAEAYRLDSQDPRIAYWYARSLVEAGFGPTADKILTEHREAIEKNYPGLADRLRAQVEANHVLEQLPRQLKSRIDQLNSAARQLAGGDKGAKSLVWFRITDSEGQAVNQTNFRLECNASSENLEAYDDGYYLLTFTAYHNPSGSAKCRLEIVGGGLKPEQFEFLARSDQVAKGGEFIVDRFSKDDEVSVHFQIHDAQQSPIPDATVLMRARNSQGYDRSSLPVKSDAAGNVTISLSADGLRISSFG